MRTKWGKYLPPEAMEQVCDLLELIAREDGLSLRAAAERLGCAPTTLSDLVANVEDYFGMPAGGLIRRDRERGLRPTAESEAVYRACLHCLSELNKVRQVRDWIGGPPRERI